MESMLRRIDGTKFEMWKLKMEDLLIDWDLYDEINENKKNLTDLNSTT